jgi:hypothetical protein
MCAPVFENLSFFLVGLGFEIRASHFKTGAIPFEPHLARVYIGPFPTMVAYWKFSILP